MEAGEEQEGVAPVGEEYGEEEAEYEYGEEEEEEGYVLEFEEGTDPIDLVHEATDGVELYERFERLEYEALAERKRKALEDRIEREETAKRPRQDELLGATMEEIDELMNFGFRKRRRRNFPRKRGRRKGSKGKLSPEVSRKIGDATLHYASGDYKMAIPLLHEVVQLAPNVPDAYHLLGLIHDSMGDRKKAFNFHMIAAFLRPRDGSLWRKLVSWSVEQKDAALVKHCLSKAISADPKDIGFKFDGALLYLEMGDYQKSAELYEQIIGLCPNNVEACKMAAKMYKKCGQIDKAINILEDYLKVHNSKPDMSLLDLLMLLYISSCVHSKALELVESARVAFEPEKKKLPLKIEGKAVICHAFLGNMDYAEAFLQDVQSVSSTESGEVIYEIADTLFDLGKYDYAIKFYLTLEQIAGDSNGNLYIKIAQCYQSLKERNKAIPFFYKALDKMQDNVDIRMTLASLLLEDGKQDETILLLSPPQNSESISDTNSKSNAWWLSGKVKLQLSKIYREKGMMENFANTIFSPVRETLIIESNNQKVKPPKKLSYDVLVERAKILGEKQTDKVFHGYRPIASSADLAKATRAKKLLEKRAAEREAKNIEAGEEYQTEDSYDKLPRKEKQEPPLPGFLQDLESHQFLLDLCKALASLHRYSEALDIIKQTLKIDTIPDDEKEELRSFGAKIAYGTTDPKHGFYYVRHKVEQNPCSNSAWNCYYKVASRLEDRYSKHAKFIPRIRKQRRDSVPPIIISGHQLNASSHHQEATANYLEAYKLQADNPLINLCVGMSLINLSLGFRLQNKHQCIIQGFAFLYNYLRLCDNSQEALYNIARAYHHVGMVTLAVSYYEKVLAMEERDYTIPRLPYERDPPSIRAERDQKKPGFCDLHREAAYNLHLIYKESGATDLARQILKTYCTF